jgi:hypothetical protein
MRAAAAARAILLAALLGSIAAAEGAQARERCDTYRGRVTRGQSFERPLGDGLVLPLSHGWAIGVAAAGRPDEDFARLATPPYRGINALVVEGWHFRNRANTGPNEGDVNAPQQERDFAFVLTPADYRRAAQALDAPLGAHGGSGRLHITGSSLGNLVAGAQAWFEWMAFDVELCRPTG